MGDEAGNKHKQNHEKFGPGEATPTHLYLQILEADNDNTEKTLLRVMCVELFLKPVKIPTISQGVR